MEPVWLDVARAPDGVVPALIMITGFTPVTARALRRNFSPSSTLSR